MNAFWNNNLSLSSSSTAIQNWREGGDDWQGSSYGRAGFPLALTAVRLDVNMVLAVANDTEM